MMNSMTELLYLKDSYLREFEATVTAVSGKMVSLDRTAFYPESGGQPTDKGVLFKGEKVFQVISVKKVSGQLMHEVDSEGLKVGDNVKARIDWERRYRLMRMHTACHVLAAVINRETGALITGNQLGLDESRVDFSLEHFDREKMVQYVQQTNEILERGLAVETKVMPRDEALKIPAVVKLAGALPPAIPELRIVSIGDVDVQADGGTHVRNTEEVGEVVLLEMENKGKSNRRLYFGLR